jgi:large subunit ribosomal protein L9
MQIILLEKVQNLGQLGDVVKVKDGYARNFLIPQGKAKRANTANLAEFEARRAELEKLQADALAKAQAAATRMEGLTIQISQKAGVDGRLFGSVTNHDIAEAIVAQGFELDAARSACPRVRSSSWVTTLVVALHHDVTANITVSVLGEH